MNRLTNCLLNTVMILALVVSFSCSSEEEDPVVQVNTGKQINTFKLYIVQPEGKIVGGVIDQSTRKITVELGVDDQFSNIMAEATLSTGATISPLPSTARNYETPVTFTVTAEDNSSAEYTVEVKRVKMAITGVSKQTIEPGSTFTITGQHLFTTMYGRSVLLVNATGERWLQTGNNTLWPDGRTEIADVEVPEMMEIGSYTLKVRFDDFDSVTWATPVVIDFPNHNTVITEVKTDKYLPSGETLYRYQLYVRGRFLGNATVSDLQASKVYLVQKTNESVKQELTKGSWSGSGSTYFHVGTNIPAGTLAAGEYYVEIVYNGITHRHTQTVTYPW